MTSWYSHLSWAQTTSAPEAATSEIPLILFCVLGVPLFLTMVYLLMQLTRPDRGGRIDLEVLQREQERHQTDDTEDNQDPRE